MRTLGDEQCLGKLVQALALARPLAQVHVTLSRYEERIQFAMARVDELRGPRDAAPVRADRLRAAQQILDEHVNRAEAFLDLIASDIIARRAA